jgi:hypothetical protein
MRILHLTLKAKFFDMIASGEKKEEYREIKLYWESRLCSGFPHRYAAKDFDAIRFARGGHFHPSIPQLLIEWKGMEMRTGKPEWGAEPGKEYFVIKLGEIIPPTKNQ